MPIGCWLRHPILTNEELAALKHMNHRGWRTASIDITFDRARRPARARRALDRICAEAERGHRRRLF